MLRTACPQVRLALNHYPRQSLHLTLTDRTPTAYVYSGKTPPPNSPP